MSSCAVSRWPAALRILQSVLCITGVGWFVAGCSGAGTEVEASAENLAVDDLELLYAGGVIVNEPGLTGQPEAAVWGASLSVHDRAAGAQVVGITAGSPDLDFALGDYEVFHQTYASAVKGDPVSIAAIAEGPKSLALELERDLAAIRRDEALGATDLSHTRFANPLAVEAQDDSLLIVDCLEEHTGSNLYSHSSFRLHQARLDRNGDQWSVATFIPVTQQEEFSDHDYGCVPSVHRQIVLNSMPELLDLLDRFWFDPLSNYDELRQRVAPVQGQSQLDEFAAFADSGLYIDGESIHTVRVRGSVPGPGFPLIAVQVCSETPEGLASRRLSTGELVGSGAGAVSLPPGSVMLREFLLVVDGVGSGEPSVQIGRVSSHEVEIPSCQQ